MDGAAGVQGLEVGRGEGWAGMAAGASLLFAGDMGIGNTTASACLICALGGLAPEEVVGFGTGIDTEVREHKADVVRRALARAGSVRGEQALAELGGLEIAAMAITIS